jgi:hypothetical protein
VVKDLLWDLSDRVLRIRVVSGGRGSVQVALVAKGGFRISDSSGYLQRSLQGLFVGRGSPVSCRGFMSSAAIAKRR